MRTVIAVLTLLAAPAGAEGLFPSQGLYVGAYAGAHFPVDDWAVGADARAEGRIGDGGVIGVRVGGAVLRWVGFEANLGYLPISTDSGTLNVVDFATDVWGQIDHGPVAVFAKFGFGLYGTADGSVGGDADWHTHYGFGIKYAIAEKFALRFDTRHTIADGLEGKSHVFEIAFGVDFWVF